MLARVGCRAVHRSAPTAGEPLLLALLESLPSLPQEPLLQYTAALTIAAYSDWLADTLKSAQAGDLIPALLQLLARGAFYAISPPSSNLQS